MSLLLLIIREETERRPGPRITIHCPACETHNAIATTYDEDLRHSIFGLIPIHTFHSTWVNCVHCGVTLNARISAAALVGRSPIELADLLFFPATFGQKAIAVIALVVAVFPFIGQIIAISALAVNWNVRSWPNLVSCIACALSLTCAGLLGVALVLDAMGLWKQLWV